MIYFVLKVSSEAALNATRRHELQLLLPSVSIAFTLQFSHLLQLCKLFLHLQEPLSISAQLLLLVFLEQRFKSVLLLGLFTFQVLLICFFELLCVLLKAARHSTHKESAIVLFSKTIGLAVLSAGVEAGRRMVVLST